LNVTPERNDGTTNHRLRVGEVRVDGFWSISVYDEDGLFRATTARPTPSTTSRRSRMSTVR
jgi:hypothetical protein